MKINSGRDFTNAILSAFKEAWPAIVQQEGDRLSQEFIDRVKQVIDQQEQSWPPLNPRYLARKIRRGRDPRMLVSAGAYKESFEKSRIGGNNGDVTTWRMAPSSSRHQESGLTFAQLGMVHEYGSPARRIPPRPHWRPVLQEFEGKKAEIETQLLNKVVSQVHSRLVVG